MRCVFTSAIIIGLAVSAVAENQRADEFACQAQANPWYPDVHYPRLITPQWVGEEGVECVVTLGIDDMRDPARYELYLRPILNRLKQIDGRAPVSIMTCSVKPGDPQLQSWLDEGLSIEVHTIDHPCPLLNSGDFGKAKSTFDRCVDLLNQIPGNAPVAFRTPCCDSLNTVSPRFYSEIFPRPTPAGHRLQIDSSVFTFFTSEDQSIPKKLVLDDNGRERFMKYLPRKNNVGGRTHDRFVNYIRNYPYPYVINDSCWQFPCVAPSDWSAQHLHGSNNPVTVDDWKAALDITVHKQGVFNLVFHPHGWIKAEQVVELIDHAVEKHGRKVKFLTFREAADRLKKILLRRDTGDAASFLTAGQRLLDADQDGFLDVVSAPGTLEEASDDSEVVRELRLWDNGRWRSFEFPMALSATNRYYRGPTSFLFFCETSDNNSRVSLLSWRQKRWHFDNGWHAQTFHAFERRKNEHGVESELLGEGVVVRDFDGDGTCEIFVSRAGPRSSLWWTPARAAQGLWQWKNGDFVKTNAHIPFPAEHVEPEAIHFVDVDADGQLDMIFSTKERTGVALFQSVEEGWGEPIVLCDHNQKSPTLLSVARTEERESFFDGKPSEVVTNNGFFVRDRHFCWINEDTSQLPDFTYRVAFDDLLAKHRRREKRAQQPPVSVGASRIDITPDYPVRLTGYGNRQLEAESAAVRIHARALAIGGEGDQPLSVLLTVDNCGVPAAVTESVWAEVIRKHQVDRERFVICSTHTHSGPWLRGFAPNILTVLPDEHAEHLRRYESELKERLVQVAAAAIRARRPARLSMGYGTAGFAMNRRVVQNGQWTGFGETKDGPVDQRLPVLAAHDMEGQLICVLANYACHATTETGAFNEVSGDWPGFAADMLEADLQSAGHKTPVALVAIGCGADANPSPRGTHAQAQEHGRTIADEVLRLLSIDNGAAGPGAAGEPAADGSSPSDSSPTSAGQAVMYPIGHSVDCRLARVDLPLGPLPPLEEWKTRAQQFDHAGMLAQKFLEQLEAGQALPKSVSDYPVQTWCFGEDLAMVFLGGEVVVDYSIRLSEMFDDERLWVNAYSNAVPCYIPSKRILREGGYEVDRSMVYYGFPTRLAPEAEDIICDTVQKLLPPTYYSQNLQGSYPAPKSPEESLSGISVRPGLRVELVAAEPLIQDPVAFDWDVQGRLWVVEMRDYPLGKGQGAGRVRVLEDTDGNGRYDKATTFLDELSYPNGICFWRNGVLITGAPDVTYAEDTDGDLQADVLKTLYTGFAEGNQQHRVNGLRWGLDGWLYLANGDSGGAVHVENRLLETDKRTVTGAVNINGRDLRIQPDFGGLETLSGQTQFCRSRDDFGNWFGNNNSNPIWHYIHEERYLRRNPHVVAPPARAEVSETPGPAPVYPVSTTLARFNDFNSSNRFTSACSTMICRDNCLGAEFYGNAFTCEPVHNLVSRLVLQRDGVHFRGARADDERDSEFFASDDNWCRPVMIRTGPDGALYVADMYRLVIEHPQWIPAEQQRKLDLYAGTDRGRIYRIVPAGEDCCLGPAIQGAGRAAKDNQKERDATDPAPDRTWLQTSASQVPAAHLVRRLGGGGGWWRDTAQRLLLHRGLAEDSTLSAIANICREHPSPACRVQALWTFFAICPDPGSDALSRGLLLAALQDSDPEVRRNAVRLCERVPEFSSTEHVELRDRIRDESPVVRLQMAASLGEFSWAADGTDLAELLTSDVENPHIVAAGLSSLNESNVGAVLSRIDESSQFENADLFAAVMRTALGTGRGRVLVEPLQRMIAGLSDRERQANADSWRSAAVVLDRIAGRSELAGVVRNSPDSRKHWQDAVDQARLIALDTSRPVGLRVAVLEFLQSARTNSEGVLSALVQLLGAQTPPEIQQQSLRTMLLMPRDEIPEVLFARWKSLTPSVRSIAMTGILNREAWIHHLLTAVKTGTVAPRELDASMLDRLLNHRERTVAEAAAELFKSPVTDRHKIVENYLSRLAELSGSRQAGRVVFEKRCAVCHRLDSIGKSVGADLAALKDRSLEALLTAILNPNKAVESKFLSYTAVTTEGLTHSGMLMNESATSVMMLGTDGKQKTILRGDIEELVCSNRSLMPEGLEKDLSEQDLADVIFFVQTAGRKSKSFPGNVPRMCRPAEDGTITLPASAAEIYGPGLVFEARYGNLGFWGSSDDYAVWSIDVPVSGHWTVEVDYACSNGTAGNPIRFSTGSRLLTARVPGSGTWDDYRTWNAGKIDLGRGRRQLIVTAAEQPSSFLIDLRGIRLIPPDE